MTSTLDLRQNHPFKPYTLAFHNPTGRLVEVMSWPCEDDESDAIGKIAGNFHVTLMARMIIDDPTTLEQVLAEDLQNPPKEVICPACQTPQTIHKITNVARTNKASADAVIRSVTAGKEIFYYRIPSSLDLPENVHLRQPWINCPRCGLGYHLVAEVDVQYTNGGKMGDWFADRPLKILSRDFVNNKFEFGQDPQYNVQATK